jgi:hypothetical protein
MAPAWQTWLDGHIASNEYIARAKDMQSIFISQYPFETMPLPEAWNYYRINSRHELYKKFTGPKPPQVPATQTIQTTLDLQPGPSTPRSSSPLKRPRAPSAVTETQEDDDMDEVHLVDTPPPNFEQDFDPKVNYLCPNAPNDAMINYLTWLTIHNTQPLRSHITHLENSLDLMQSQLNQLALRPASTPTPAPAPIASRAPPATTKGKGKASYATILTSGGPLPPPQEPKAKPAPLITPDYTRVDREIVAELSAPIPDSVPDVKILTAINTALKDTGVAFALCRRTQKENIILQTHLHIPANLAEPYLDTISHTLFELGITTTNIKVNSKWTKLVIHNIPTNLGEGPEAGIALATELKIALPGITLSQIPRWLTTKEARSNKTRSAMVIAIPGKYSMKSLGISYINLFNKTCKIAEYVSISASTQCKNCQGYGHHSLLCTKPPVCSVCAGNPDSSKHHCILPKCGGAKCTHPPLKCVNCPNFPGHKASDPSCLARAKARLPKTNPMET